MQAAPTGRFDGGLQSGPAARTAVDMDALRKDVSRQRQMIEQLRGVYNGDPAAPRPAAAPAPLATPAAPPPSGNSYLPGSARTLATPYAPAMPASATLSGTAMPPSGVPPSLLLPKKDPHIPPHLQHAMSQRAAGTAPLPGRTAGAAPMSMPPGGATPAQPWAGAPGSVPSRAPLQNPAERRLESARQQIQEVQDQLRASQVREKALVDETAAQARDAQALKIALQKRDLQISKMLEQEDNFVHAQERVQSLEGYIQSLPTKEEYAHIMESLAAMTAERDALQARGEETEAMLQAAAAELQAKTTLLAELEDTVAGLHRTAADSTSAYTNDVQRLQQTIATVTMERDAAADASARLAAELADTKAQLEDLQQRAHAQQRHIAMLETRAVDRDTAFVGLQKQDAAHITNIQALQSQLAEAEEARAAAARRHTTQVATIKELRSAIAGLTEQNQALLAHNQRLRPGAPPLPVPALPAAPAGPADGLNELQDALQECLESLQAAVQLAVARARGDDPGLNHLLGLPASGEQGPVFARTNDVREQVATVKDMTKELESIRQRIARQYAADVGRDACAMQ
eukprot:m.17918 g.17918  ORF g.17918 m.17918 type:complete len:575 (-) comp3288_c0_seq2:202-1926(-)